MEHTDPADRPDAAHGQQHPIGLYLKIWGLLFVLSTLSSGRLLQRCRA